MSGLGKGIVAASLGRLLKSAGYTVAVEKFDPYMNIDPGTLNPVQHGEVFVTADGAETDLDLGHYERFIGVNLTKDSSLTSGKLYSAVLKKERAGAYGRVRAPGVYAARGVRKTPRRISGAFKKRHKRACGIRRRHGIERGVSFQRSRLADV